MLMTTLDLRHPIVSAALALHGVDAAEINRIVHETGVEFDYGDKAGRPGLPTVHCGRERCWVKWSNPHGIAFYLTSPDFVRRGERRPLQGVEVRGIDLPDSVLDTLPGRPLHDLAELPGAGDLHIAAAGRGVSGLVFHLQPFYHIDAED